MVKFTRQVLAITSFLWVFSCSKTEPTATEYKKALADPAVSDGGNPAAKTGDKAKGQALIASTCAVCHSATGSIGADLDEFANLDRPDLNTVHSSGTYKTIQDNLADLKAALAPAGGGTDVAAGLAVVQSAECTACHGKTAGALTSASYKGKAATGKTFGAHSAAVKTTITNNEAALEAYWGSL